MARRQNANGRPQSWPLVHAIEVEGFKSIAERQRIEIRPLTILAGANSSGKSSMMQPALLIKQTFESPYDPGALRIDGPNVKMTEFDQLFWGTGSTVIAESFDVAFYGHPGWRVGTRFGLDPKGLDILRTDWEENGTVKRLRRGATQRELQRLDAVAYESGHRLGVMRQRSFLTPTLFLPDGTGPLIISAWAVEMVKDFVRRLIHVPGLRLGTAERGDRTFPKAIVSGSFTGVFDYYFASVLHEWQRHKSRELDRVGEDLQTLGLTWKVEVEEVSDVALTIRVGRLPKRPSRGGERDLVNMGDVGFGVSQVLPVIVALRAAKGGDAVFVEQPELHLHPRAQVALAGILVDAAKRGVRVIAETHSSLLLLGIQTLAAEGKLDPETVKLHWFQRDKDGATAVTPADLDHNGAFGEWPEDFDDVSLKARKDYLDAVDTRSFAR